MESEEHRVTQAGGAARRAALYNPAMMIAPTLQSTARLLFSVVLGLSLGTLAYGATPAELVDSTPSSQSAHEDRWQHLHQEDTGSTIDEVRVGGETQRLTVQPKSKLINAPAYEFQPTNGARRSLAVGPGAESAGSMRVWNFLSF